MSLLAQCAIFLSRLCGGEFINELKINQKNFLSRLCGGEFVEHDCDYLATFLSRLCGGEFDTD